MLAQLVATSVTARLRASSVHAVSVRIQLEVRAYD